MVKDPSLYPVEEFLEIVTKYNLRSDHVATLRHLVHALGNREEIFGQEELEKLKTKSVTLYGQPHTGKTRLFRTVEKHLGGDTSILLAPGLTTFKATSLITGLS